MSPPLPIGLLRRVQACAPADAWAALARHAVEACDTASRLAGAHAAAMARDGSLASADAWLSGAGWDLWDAFGESFPKTADQVVEWWSAAPGGRAVLVLDGLSLRELPLVRDGAAANGFALGAVRATASELPGDTNAFARALGAPSRASLSNDGAPAAFRLTGARTEVSGLPWPDSAALVDASPGWLFWHEWPDSRLHDVQDAGGGFRALAETAAHELASADFWSFVRRLATGRRVLLTSDHGYAHIGAFADATEDQKGFLRDTFGASRHADGGGEAGPWTPPIALSLRSRAGAHRYPLGRRKWRTPGGNPTLGHGGLTLLEVLSPFVELVPQERPCPATASR